MHEHQLFHSPLTTATFELRTLLYFFLFFSFSFTSHWSLLLRHCTSSRISLTEGVLPFFVPTCILRQQIQITHIAKFSRLSSTRSVERENARQQFFLLKIPIVLIGAHLSQLFKVLSRHLTYRLQPLFQLSTPSPYLYALFFCLLFRFFFLPHKFFATRGSTFHLILMLCK